MPLLSLGRRHAPPDSIVALVEDYARAGGESPARLADYWGALKGSRPVSVLAALAKHEIVARFARGEHPAALEYLERFPELAGRGDLVVSLVYEEFCLLEEGGEAPSVGRFCDRYRPWSDSIASQLGYHRELSRVAGVEPGPDRYPKVGDRFGKYTLQEVLGRGGAAKVYRAVGDLGERQVVLKVSRTMGLEPAILAALNHDNIVKFHHEVESAEPGLTGICMPYHPGMTLDAALAALFDAAGTSRPPRRARALWDALGLRGLDPASAAKYWGGFPVEGTYTEAVAWIGVVMADALEYAHGLGVFHRDIKPANILIARREGPLLFDFNLAHRHSDAARAQDAMSGGTLPYMAPEQLKAFVDPALWDGVQAGADIYALGLVLRELATGRKPPLPAQGLSLARSIQALLDGRPELARSVRQEHPDVPPALDAIIRKCLAIRVGDRYADAGRLARDLRRFLARLPLEDAVNPSRLELATNWVYRNRKLVVRVAAALLVAGSALRLLRPVRVDEDPRFLEGRAILAGNDAALLPKASLIFDQLARDHPRSAWPPVFKAFTLDRVGQARADRGPAPARHELSKASFDLINEAMDKDDALAALESWRTNPATARTTTYMLGNHYASRRDFRKAREFYREAIAADAGDASPYCGMGDVARQEDRAAEAIDWYGKGLARLLDPAVPVAPRKVHLLCGFLLPLELAEVDRLLDDRSSPIDWPAARARLDEARGHLVLLERFPDSTGGPEAADREALLQAVARGGLASGLGYCLGRGERAEGPALASFREAAREYRKAGEICGRIRAGGPKVERSMREIRDREADLGLRIRESGLQGKIQSSGPGDTASGRGELLETRTANHESTADAPRPADRPPPRTVAPDG